MRPGITAAMIARNEAKTLARCIESIKDWVDEIAVVDTGSTDGSAEIAETLGARVKRIVWPDDFSIARNAALDMVETEWTLAIDADEWYDPAMGPQVREAINNDAAMGYEMACRNLFPDGRWTDHVSIRLWRTHPDLRLEGVIHEHMPQAVVAKLLAGGKKVLNTGMWFWHDGYQDRTREKAARNLPLLLKELELRPGQLYYEIELAMTYQDLEHERAAEAMESLRRRVLEMEDLDVAPTNALAAVLVRLVQGTPDADLKQAETERLMRIARGWFGDVPAVLSMIGQTEIRRGDLRAAYAALADLEEMVERGSYNKAIAVNPSMLQEHLFTNLALVAHQLGRKDVARRNYERLLRLDPNNAAARQNLAAL